MMVSSNPKPIMAPDPAAELESLALGIKRCQECRLHRSRLQAVPGEGPAGAELVFLGEGPGSREDQSGRPFVGRAGRLLDTLLRDNGIERTSVFITNCVKCRPPENRTPRRDELNTCTTLWLRRQLELISPRLVVLLGQVAARQMLGDPAAVTRLHGTIQQRGNLTCFVTYHPAAALRFDTIDAALRSDFERLGRWLAESAEIV
jgi:uracil-DNA glycosylase family 4